MKKKITLILLIFAVNIVNANIPDTSRVALLVVDIQDFYFAGGKSELVDPIPAAQNAAKLIQEFRAKGWLVVYVKHQSAEQAEINELVKPVAGEEVIVKSSVNAFVGTQLQDYLFGQQVSKLVVCGMQTHMCVEAAVRAASDLGLKVTVVHDACATKDLKWGDETIPAKMVHLSTLATLRSYAKILSTEECLKTIK